MSIHYYKHLVKLNSLRYGGRPLSLLALVVRYIIRSLFQRPTFVRLLGRDRYRQRKKLFYTVLTGSYDRLNEIPVACENWDYVCFTDNPALTSKTWEIRLLDNPLDLDPVRLSRHYKINNHLVDSGYFLSVYVDANIRVRGDLDSFASHVLPVHSSCGLLLHPFLSSLAEEVEQCVALGKDDGDLLRRQYNHYCLEKGFADQFPHINARMIIRRAGDPAVQRLMESWFAQLLSWSCRDQMGFNYALSTCPDLRPTYIPYWIFRAYFKKMDHR